MLIDGVDLKSMALEDLVAQDVFLLAGTVEENIRLARALAGDPRVLVLDEAISSVDPESERLIQQALPRVMAGRTCLVVAPTA